MEPGARLGPYQILQPLGAGGMGVVYRARDTRLDRDVAIKLLPAHLSGADDARERLRREARAIAALQHPSICAIYDVSDTDAGQLFIVLELLTGETLQQRLQRGVLPEPEATSIAIAVADALVVAHAAGIIHRDIKPANIFLTAHGPKLLDFGLAKATAASAADGATVPLVTGHGQIVGTAAYMSPEQIEGQTLDGRTDIYSLGVTLGEMLTGTRTFTAGRHPGVDACIVRATERSRDLRFQTAADFRSALLHTRHTASAAAPPPAAAPPRRTTLPLALAAVVVAGVIGGVLYMRQPRVQALTEKDTIVIADFTNTTGDTVFDDTLRQGLAVQLQQSPFLSVMPDGRIRQALQLMNRPPQTRLTGEVAIEACTRLGSAAALEGSIAPIGSRLVVGLRATTCADGAVIDQQQIEVDKKEDVLRAVGELATRFRERSGESLQSRQRFDTPLVEATTSSLEALKAYSAARRINDTLGVETALPLIRRAVDIDPNFAIAWAMLGLLYNTTGNAAASIDAATRAYQLRDHTSERERYAITALYERQVTGNLERARETFESYATTYPRDLDAHGLLSGFSTNGTGRYEQALEHAAIGRSLDPHFGFGYLNGIFANVYLDRYDAADDLIKGALAANVEMPDIYWFRYVVAYLRNNRDALAQARAEGMKRPAVAPGIEQGTALIAAREGRWDEARAAARRAIALAQSSGKGTSAGTLFGIMAIWEAMAGHTREARQAIDSALQHSDGGRDTTYAVAFALAQLRDFARVAPLVESLASRFPEDTSVRYSYLPTLRALQALNAGDAGKAVTILEEARANELGVPALAFLYVSGWAYPTYVRAHALQALGRKDDAIRELRFILQHRGLVKCDPIGALVERDLAALTGGGK